MWLWSAWVGLTLVGIDRGQLTLRASEVVETTVRVPYVLDLDRCEITAELITDQSPLECLPTPTSCPSVTWFRLDNHYYPIQGEVWIYEGAVVADGLGATHCRRAATGDEIPITAYSLLVQGELISLDYDETGALAYTVAGSDAVLGARTRHGDAVCDGHQSGPVDPPTLPWDDLIMRSPYELDGED